MSLKTRARDIDKSHIEREPSSRLRSELRQKEKNSFSAWRGEGLYNMIAASCRGGQSLRRTFVERRQSTRGEKTGRGNEIVKEKVSVGSKRAKGGGITLPLLRKVANGLL